MKIVIAGFGIEGRTNYDYFKTKFPEAEMAIADESRQIDGSVPEGADTILGPEAFSQLGDYDMVVRTAGLAPRKIVANGTIWSATNEFFAECPAPIIGVTGTKGKGTTASLIAAILRSSGKTVHLVGNIGVPALSVLEDIDANDVVVYELSSFQLWDLQKSPGVAVVLMIEPDHLDVHSDMADYVAAKSNIAAHQQDSGVAIYHPTNQLSEQIARSGVGKAYRYGTSQDKGVYVEESNFCVQGRAICSTQALRLVGEHNLENACAAITAAYTFDSELADSAIEQGLSAFDGLPHRLKLVSEVSGVRYYDDSIATTPGSAMAAIRAFKGESKVVILGGSDKGADYRRLIELCRDETVKVVAIGQTGQQINELCHELGVACHYENSLIEAVNRAHQLATGQGVVILSPAAASFGMFKNYVDRGEQFIQAVSSLN